MLNFSQRSESTNVFLRALLASDLDLVVESETLSQKNPWSKLVFSDCLEAGYECWVLATRDRIVAHGVLSVGMAAHVLTICVHPDFRHQGYGRRMLKHLLDKGYRKGARACFLEVRPSNIQARQLYVSMGFVQVDERRQYYPADPGQTQREDALILSCPLPL